MQQTTLRQNIAKKRYELELDCIRKDELSNQLDTIYEEIKKEPSTDWSYTIAIAKNNLAMVTIQIDRHTIELQEMISKYRPAA